MVAHGIEGAFSSNFLQFLLVYLTDFKQPSQLGEAILQEAFCISDVFLFKSYPDLRLVPAAGL